MSYWKHRSVIAACLCVFATAASGAGQVLVFTTIDFPGSVFTNAQGLNALGEVVGIYTDTGGKRHGFLRSGEQYRSIDFPNAQDTTARGIGPTGDIVGTYQRQNEPVAVTAHGFLMTRRGGFFKVDYPGHQNTIPQRILPDGTILGCYHDTDTMGTMHGFVMSRRGFDAIPEPASMHNGATPDGRLIVGLFTDMMDGLGKGYLLDRGRFSPFMVPDSIVTSAWDVNSAGVVVGAYRDRAGAVHGFRFDGEAFGRVDPPGAAFTQAFGVNTHGDMVGLFVDASGRTHGFLAQWAAAQ